MTRFMLLALSALAVVLSLACQKESGGAAAGGELASDDQKTVYALGLALARELEPFRLDEAELGIVARGLTDGALGRPPQVELETQMPKIQAFGQARVAAAAAEEAKESETFLAAAAAEPGAEKLASGLVYRELAPGEGASPTAADRVKVHYHGTLRDGTVFDSSVERGTPAEFGLGQVIPCWTEGVQKMKVGGKARLVCPSSIAYGERGAPPKILPGAALAFEVELIEIAPAPAPPAAKPAS